MKSNNIKKFPASLIFLGILIFSLSGCVEVPSGEISLPSDSNEITKAAATDENELQPPPAPSRAPTVRIWRDYSKSGDEEILAIYVDELITGIERGRTQIAGVEVVRFSNGENLIWREKTEKFLWGDFPDIEEFQANLENAPPNSKMFQDARRKYIDEQKVVYDKKKEQIISNYELRVKNQLDKLREYLLQSPPVPASCTRFTELATRMKQENILKNVTLTDGWADCENESVSTISPVVMQGKHIIIQLTKNTDTQTSGDELKQRELFLKTLFPSAEIFPVYSTTKAIDALFQGD